MVLFTHHRLQDGLRGGGGAEKGVRREEEGGRKEEEGGRMEEKGVRKEEVIKEKAGVFLTFGSMMIII